MTSVLTNTAAAVALQTLRATGRDLDATARQVSTGLQVGDGRGGLLGRRLDPARG